MPDGLWTKCPDCSTVIYRKELVSSSFTCKQCDHHFRIGANKYVDILIDHGTWTETEHSIRSADPLGICGYATVRGPTEASLCQNRSPGCRHYRYRQDPRTRRLLRLHELRLHWRFLWAAWWGRSSLVLRTEH